MLSLLSLVFFFLTLAGQHVFAFNVTLDGEDFTVAELLDFAPGPYLTDQCTQACNSANSSVANCAQDDDTCFCTNDTATALQECEQCLFDFLVDENIAASDSKVGNVLALTGYVSACESQANVTLPKLALTLPSSWNGPFVAVLNTPATAVVVGTGAVIGATFLYMLSTID